MECLERMKPTLFLLFGLFVQAKRIYCDVEDPNPDRLVKLHPPMNVTVAFHSSTEAYLFWYPPINYENHEPIENETELSLTFITRTPPVLSSNLTQTGLPSNKTDIKTQSNKTSENQTGSSNTSSDTGVSYNISNSKMGNQTILMTTKALDKNSTVTVKPPLPKMGISEADDMVPFHKAVLKVYRVVYKPVDSGLETNITVDENVTEVHLKNLSPSTNYSITVSAIYMTFNEIASDPVYVTTEKDPVPACVCDMIGTEGEGDRMCNMSLTDHPWCKCKTGYAGLFCEYCAFGYYRLNPFMPCHPCPCRNTISSGSCHFVEGYLHCSYCNPGYTGNLCHKCSNGYYRQRIDYPSMPLILGDCIPCNCNNNTNLNIPDICDLSGRCTICIYNTSGDNCEKCRPEYVGDPIKAKNCTHIKDTKGQVRHLEIPAIGVIAGVIVGVMILLCAIIGFIVYRRLRHYKPPRPFWTVELKDDHEGVSFSSVPEDELQNREALEDMKFYEEQGGIVRNGAQMYAPLREAI